MPRFKIITTQEVDMDINQKLKILSTTVETIPLDQIIDDYFELTESNIHYGYVTLGRYSKVQLPLDCGIKVVYEEVEYSLKTHKTQLNRIDRMRPIIKDMQPGQKVKINYDLSKNVLTLF